MFKCLKCKEIFVQPKLEFMRDYEYEYFGAKEQGILIKGVCPSCEFDTLRELDSLDEEDIKDIELVLTCDACPEQYDAYFNGKNIGYLRLRHGLFTVHDSSGDCVYHATPKGDGCFWNDEERSFYLLKAKKALLDGLMGGE